jgi:hypothetical protein
MKVAITRDEHGGGRAAAAGSGIRLGVADVIAGADFQCVTCRWIPEGMISRICIKVITERG